MKILIQNLQKQPGLATSLLREYDPDVMLAQEINLRSENSAVNDLSFHLARNTSKFGYGTAIFSKRKLENVKLVESPYAEFGMPMMRKKTIIASTTTLITQNTEITFISFHGYNGMPMKRIDKLVAHVSVVLEACVSSLSSSSPVVFAGDFNTWTQDHLNAVKKLLEDYGFSLAYSWPYPGRNFPLDHVFLRNLRLKNNSPPSYFSCSSDHNGAIIELEV